MNYFKFAKIKIYVASTCHSIWHQTKFKKKRCKWRVDTYMRRWRGGTGCSRHRDTDRPTPRSPSLTFTSLLLTLHLCSPCLALYLLPHLPPPRYHLSSPCNTHLQAAAAVQRVSAATVSKVPLDCRMLSLAGVCEGVGVSVCVCVLLKNISVWKGTQKLHACWQRPVSGVSPKKSIPHVKQNPHGNKAEWI